MRHVPDPEHLWKNSSFHRYGQGYCPVCGDWVYIIGRTTDGRIIGACNDAFTEAQWGIGLNHEVPPDRKVRDRI